MSHSITLDLPDALYEKFKQRSQQTNRSVEDELLAAFALDLPILATEDAIQFQAYNEVFDFLSRGPSRQEIVQFQLSETIRERVQSLLDQDHNQGLTATEAKELDFYVELGDFLGILRAKTQLQLKNET